jgi:hypothetical protein
LLSTHQADGPEQEEAKDSFSLAGVMACVADTAMLALQGSVGVVTAYICGVYPLYSGKRHFQLQMVKNMHDYIHYTMIDNIDTLATFAF